MVAHPHDLAGRASHGRAGHQSGPLYKELAHDQHKPGNKCRTCAHSPCGDLPELVPLRSKSVPHFTASSESLLEPKLIGPRQLSEIRRPYFARFVRIVGCGDAADLLAQQPSSGPQHTASSASYFIPLGNDSESAARIRANEIE